MIIILIYFLSTLEVVKMDSKGTPFPTLAYAIGGAITIFYLMQLPLFIMIAIIKNKGQTLYKKIRGAFKPANNWGPQDPILNRQYIDEMAEFDNIDRYSVTQDLWSRVTRREKTYDVRPTDEY